MLDPSFPAGDDAPPLLSGRRYRRFKVTTTRPLLNYTHVTAERFTNNSSVFTLIVLQTNI